MSHSALPHSCSSSSQLHPLHPSIDAIGAEIVVVDAGNNTSINKIGESITTTQKEIENDFSLFSTAANNVTYFSQEPPLASSIENICNGSFTCWLPNLPTWRSMKHQCNCNFSSKHNCIYDRINSTILLVYPQKVTSMHVLPKIWWFVGLC